MQALSLDFYLWWIRDATFTFFTCEMGTAMIVGTHYAVLHLPGPLFAYSNTEYMNLWLINAICINSLVFVHQSLCNQAVTRVA